MTTRTTLEAKARRLCELLAAHYGDKISPRRLAPVDELVLTILSQNTTDTNAWHAFEELKSRFSSWEELLDGDPEDVEEAIRPSGAFRVKTQRILAALREIGSRVGRLDLTCLGEMPLDEAMSWLTSLHGVGPKTAAIVLLFSFHRPVLPVDTHVYRVSRRIGLIGKRVTREKAPSILESLIPVECIFSLNHNLVRHGRSVCRARSPLCSECFLQDICDYAHQSGVAGQRQPSKGPSGE